MTCNFVSATNAATLTRLPKRKLLARHPNHLNSVCKEFLIKLKIWAKNMKILVVFNELGMALNLKQTKTQKGHYRINSTNDTNNGLSIICSEM